jgi:hypothetical protein
LHLVYLKGNPWPLGTEIYVLVPVGFTGKCGLIMSRKLSITSSGSFVLPNKIDNS